VEEGATLTVEDELPPPEEVLGTMDMDGEELTLPVPPPVMDREGLPEVDGVPLPPVRDTVGVGEREVERVEDLLPPPARVAV